MNLTKMWYLSNTDWRILTTDLLDSVEEQEFTEEAIHKIAEELSYMMEEDKVDGFIYYDSEGNMVVVYNDVFDIIRELKKI
jgi:hypothetical protein